MYSSRNSLKLFGILVLVSHLAFESKHAEAVSLEFVPDTQTVDVGDPVTVGVFASNRSGTLIGTYDFFVNYESSVLTLDQVVFGTALGGVALNFPVSSESPAGRVNVSEISFLSISNLTPLQNGTDDVLLLTMVFDTVMPGTSSLSFSEGIVGAAAGFLGDENGQAITLDSVGTGSINVVPIPGAIWLMGSGLIALFGVKTRRNNQSRTTS